MNKKILNREANLELLRAIAMLMVVIMHALGHGGVLEQLRFGSLQYFLFWLLSTLCQVAVPCFVLISGYFLIESDFKPSRIVRLLIQVLFYSIISALFRMTFLDKQISLSVVLHGFFPITSGEYWFITQYCILLVISPLLNRIAHQLTESEYRRTILYLSLLYSIIPTFLFWSRSFFSDGYDLAWFILLYFIAGYMRRFGKRIARGGCWYLLISLFGVGTRVSIGLLANRLTGSYAGAGLFYGGNSILMLISSVSLFSVFLDIKIINVNYNHIINRLASCSIGVYLFHNSTAIREVLWGRLNPPKYIQNFLYEFFWILVISVAIYCFGCLIEAFRQFIFMRLFNEQKLLDKVDTVYKNHNQ